MFGEGADCLLLQGGQPRAESLPSGPHPAPPPLACWSPASSRPPAAPPLAAPFINPRGLLGRKAGHTQASEPWSLPAVNLGRGKILEDWEGVGVAAPGAGLRGLEAGGWSQPLRRGAVRGTGFQGAGAGPEPLAPPQGEGRRAGRKAGLGLQGGCGPAGDAASVGLSFPICHQLRLSHSSWDSFSSQGVHSDRQDGESGAVWGFSFSLGGMLGLMTLRDMAEWTGSPLGGLRAKARPLPRPGYHPTPHLHALVPPESVLASLGPGGLPEGNTLLR